MREEWDENFRQRKEWRVGYEQIIMPFVSTLFQNLEKVPFNVQGAWHAVKLKFVNYSNSLYVFIQNGQEPTIFNHCDRHTTLLSDKDNT